jgi:hypothetical protein
MSNENHGRRSSYHSSRVFRDALPPRGSHGIPATVLLRELRERGYTGGTSQLKTFLAPLEHAEPEPVVRFETAPNKQMQANFTVIRCGRAPLLEPSLSSRRVEHCPQYFFVLGPQLVSTGGQIDDDPEFEVAVLSGLRILQPCLFHRDDFPRTGHRRHGDLHLHAE